jgi:hypothetical protein
MKRKPPKTVTFNTLGSPIEDSVIEDVHSEADEVLRAQGLRNSEVRRIRHLPGGRARWPTAVAVATIVAAVVGVVALLLQLL